jgi:hypothetical protein
VGLASLFKDSEHRLRVDWIFRLGVTRVFACDPIGDDPLEIRERLVCQRIDIPGLQVSAGSCPLRADDQLANDTEIERLVEKGAARNA